jgi:hypothetical protein
MIFGQKREFSGRPYRIQPSWSKICASHVDQFCHARLGFEGVYLVSILTASTVGGIVAYVLAVKKMQPRWPLAFFIGQVLFSLLCGVVAAGLMPPCSNSAADLVGLTGSATCYALIKAAPFVFNQIQKDKQ